MALTPVNCTDYSLTETKDDACELVAREINVRAVGFYKASQVLPYPLTEAVIIALMKPEATPEDPTPKKALVFSNELVNVTLADPQTTERKLSDSRPPSEVVESREITFQDRLKVEVKEGETTVFKDYEFWKNKQEHSATLNYVFVMSDGSIIVPRQKNSLHGMPASFSVFRNFEAQAQGGAIEFKQAKIKFLGDPFDFVQPDINLNDIPEVAGLW